MEDDANGKLETLRAAYAAQPLDAQNAARLAEHYTDLGWYNEALDVYREALAKNPDDFVLLLGYGNACFRHRDFDEALTSFKKVTSLNPGRIEGWINAGITHMVRGNIDDARTAFINALEIEPDNAGVLLNQGNCRARQGDMAEAVPFFERAIAAQPDYADAWFNLGNACLVQMEFPKAKASFEKAIRYKREFPAAIKNLGFVHEQLQQWDVAASCYRKAAELDKTDASTQINLANVFLAQDKIEEAKNCFLKAVKLAPRNTGGWLGLRHCALLKGDVASYLRATSAVLSHLDGTAIAWSIEILLELNHPDEAHALVTGADTYQKKSDELDAQRLLVYRRFGENGDEQTAIYKRLNSLDAPGDPVVKALARYDFLTGNFGGARRRLAALPKNDAAAQEIMVRSLLAMDKKEEARAALLRAMSEWPAHGTLLFLRARLAAEDNTLTDAETYLVRALENGFASVDEISSHVGLKAIFTSLLAEPLPAEALA